MTEHPKGSTGVEQEAWAILADSRPINPRAVMIGEWFERRSDHSLHQVRNVFRYERRVQLAPDIRDLPRTVTFDELKRDYVRTER